ncbi:hypothetical protein WA026_003051 [Henosepilachna vigintioctopunctata]|uniref:Phorbol-ester/DAG-type domain-containing protein n=1 Tax=Henosepilachna vigintioctopunctata TaxID=420089 RepID=A0AAW1THW3_9CUCU
MFGLLNKFAVQTISGQYFLGTFASANKHRNNTIIAQMASGTYRSVLAPGKMCRRCNNMPLNGIKCVKCGSLNHPGCVEYLKNAIKLSDESLICCEVENPLNDSTKSFNSANNGEENETVSIINVEQTELQHLKELLNHKDMIIKHMQEVIVSLRSHIIMHEKYENLKKNKSA